MRLGTANGSDRLRVAGEADGRDEDDVSRFDGVVGDEESPSVALAQSAAAAAPESGGGAGSATELATCASAPVTASTGASAGSTAAEALLEAVGSAIEAAERGVAGDGGAFEARRLGVGP